MMKMSSLPALAIMACALSGLMFMSQRAAIILAGEGATKPGANAASASSDTALAPMDAENAPGNVAAAMETVNTQGKETQTTIVLSSWWERIVQSTTGSGGFVMYILFGLSVVSLGFAFERLFHLSCRAIIPPGISIEAMELWKKEDYDGILALCRRTPSSLSRIIAALVEHRHCERADITQVASDLASRESRLEMQKSYPLQVVASLATMLGLLGTVVGMVMAFEKVSGAGTLGNASILADDISLALMTTMLGLCVAVPSLALYHWFRSRTVRLFLLLEGEVNAIISAWFLPRRT